MRFFLLSLTILACWAAEAPKLPADVQTAIDKATAAETAAQNEADTKILKVKQALVKDLTKLQETYTKKGNLDASNGIKAEVDKLQEYIEKVTLEAKNETVKDITIDGTAKNGALVGDVTVGQTVTLQYVSGRWKSWGNQATECPDTATQERGNACRVAILINDKPVTIIPAGTTTKPFQYKVPANGKMTLRINDEDGDWASNPAGSVIYKFTTK
jgi:hypothetical protein